MKRSAYLIAHRRTRTNRALVQAFRRLVGHATILRPEQAYALLRPGDVALARLDVTRRLDGIEPGLIELDSLVHRGIRLLNHPFALVTAHDKVATARRLSVMGVPHPRTLAVEDWDRAVDVELPVVVKPRFGSWGRDVVLCNDAMELTRCVRRLRRKSWSAQGAVMQEYVGSPGFDMRVLVAGGEVVGAIERVPSAGEWRTNVSLGGHRRQAYVSPEGRELALTAAAAIGGDFVGVDLLPRSDGRYVVLEVNPAVDLTQEYAMDTEDVFDRVARLLLHRHDNPADEAALAPL